jgi:FlaA1/EpsC-like NDP-sugar epimerase
MNNKKILILGGTGSLGYALINRLVANNNVMVFSRDEAKHWTIRNEIQNDNLLCTVGDIRDGQRVSEIISKFKPNVIIVAAALKQVDTCELSPYESIQTNILGVKNVTDAVERRMAYLEDELECVLMVSTDKACAPANVYGMCKAISERLITSCSNEYTNVKFVGVRYGNVLESRGSIIPLFRHQASNAEAFTLTHDKMTRFVMTLDDSIDLILNTVEKAKSGEIWLPKLRSMRIIDLANIFSKRYGKPVKIIGMRPGEKLHEALLSDAESPRVRDIGDHYILKAAHEEVDSNARIFEYTSADDVLNEDALQSYLTQIGILEKSLKDFPGLHIEEIRTT